MKVEVIVISHQKYLNLNTIGKNKSILYTKVRDSFIKQTMGNLKFGRFLIIFRPNLDYFSTRQWWNFRKNPLLPYFGLKSGKTVRKLRLKNSVYYRLWWLQQKSWSTWSWSSTAKATSFSTTAHCGKLYIIINHFMQYQNSKKLIIQTKICCKYLFRY